MADMVFRAEATAAAITVGLVLCSSSLKPKTRGAPASPAPASPAPASPTHRIPHPG